MADQKISQLTGGGAAQATDEYVVARAGGNNKITGANVAAAATSVGTLSSLTVSGSLAVDTNTLYVDAANNRVGIGTASPGYALQVDGASTAGFVTPLVLKNPSTNAASATKIGFDGGGTVWGEIGVSYNTNSPYMAFFVRAGSEKMRLDDSGNLGLGVTPSAWADYKALQTTGAAFMGYSDGASNNQAIIAANAFFTTGSTWKYIYTDNASYYRQFDGQHQWFNAPSGTAGNAISFTQAMTLDASGNLGVGTTSPSGKLSVSGFKTASGLDNVSATFSDATNSSVVITHAGGKASLGTDGAQALCFLTDKTERARITSGGEFVVGKQSTAVTDIGMFVTNDGRVIATTGDQDCLVCNRQNSDGTLVEFRQANTTEGTISVSGNTVSYNAFAGSHWSQLEDGSKPEILRGTVMEALNELCEWPDETNERLPKAKVSDTAGSKKVYGVFMDWDNDWTETNDMLITSVGAFICRVAADVVVEQGDLLESNGDGTARVQADDVIRSSTIGKVTSTVKTHEYEDGTYCVPTVLYCG